VSELRSTNIHREEKPLLAVNCPVDRPYATRVGTWIDRSAGRPTLLVRPEICTIDHIFGAVDQPVDQLSSHS